jgi:tetratricopeptide (TPR) repeat protein
VAVRHSRTMRAATAAWTATVLLLAVVPAAGQPARAATSPASAPAGQAIAAARPLPLPPGAAAGQLLPRVDCAAAPGTGYALYLPASWSPTAVAPAIFALDSRRQSVELVELLRPAADRFGFVVVSPLDTAGVDAPQDNAAKIRAAWVDSHDRLALDERRTYAVAFSGMVRLAYSLAELAPGTFAGIVALSGGFPLGTPPGEEPRLPFYGLVGEEDFSYHELRDIESRLAAAGVPQHLEVWPGSHEWPPAAELVRALGWMELQGMREGRRPVDAGLVTALWQEEVARAEARDAAADPLDAARGWDALAAGFDGMRDVSAARERLVAIRGGAAYQEALRAEERRLARDRAYLERAPVLLHGAWDGTPDAGELLAALDVPTLQRREKDDPDPAERLSASRLLYAVYIQAALYLPREFNDRGEHRRALFYLEVASAIDPEVPNVPYRQAVTWALLGNRREALRALERAVELGWDDAAAARAEPEFAELLQDRRFQEVLARMEALAAASPE